MFLVWFYTVINFVQQLITPIISVFNQILVCKNENTKIQMLPCSLHLQKILLFCHEHVDTLQTGSYPFWLFQKGKMLIMWLWLWKLHCKNVTNTITFFSIFTRLYDEILVIYDLFEWEIRPFYKSYNTSSFIQFRFSKVSLNPDCVESLYNHQNNLLILPVSLLYTSLYSIYRW